MATTTPPGVTWFLVDDFPAVLARTGLFSLAQLERAHKERHRTGRRLGRILVDDGAVDEGLLFDTLAELFRLPRFNLREDPVELSAGSRCDEQWVRMHGIVPVWVDTQARILHVATPDPSRKVLFAQLRGRTGLFAHPLVASESETEALYKHIYRKAPLIRDPVQINRPGPRLEPMIEDDDAIFLADDLVEEEAPSDPSIESQPAKIPARTSVQTHDLEWLQPLLQTQQLSARQLRLIVELCEAQGLFTREEYLTRLKLRTLSSVHHDD